MLGFPHTCHPSYGGLALTPAGFAFLLNTLAFIGHTQHLRLFEIPGLAPRQNTRTQELQKVM
jgi:hypothetical protein